MRTRALLALLSFACALGADIEHHRSNPNATDPKPDSMVIKLYSNGKLDTVIVLPKLQGLPIDKLPEWLRSPKGSWQFDSDHQSLQDFFRQAEEQYKYAEQMYKHAQRLFKRAQEFLERYKLSTEDKVVPPLPPDLEMAPPLPPPHYTPPDPEQFQQIEQQWRERLQTYLQNLEDFARQYNLDSALSRWNTIPRMHKNMLEAIEQAIEQLSEALKNVDAFSKQFYEMMESLRPKLEQLHEQLKKLQPRRIH